MNLRRKCNLRQVWFLAYTYDIYIYIYISTLNIPWPSPYLFFLFLLVSVWTNVNSFSPDSWLVCQEINGGNWNKLWNVSFSRLSSERDIILYFRCFFPCFDLYYAFASVLHDCKRHRSSLYNNWFSGFSLFLIDEWIVDLTPQKCYTKFAYKYFILIKTGIFYLPSYFSIFTYMSRVDNGTWLDEKATASPRVWFFSKNNCTLGEHTSICIYVYINLKLIRAHVLLFPVNWQLAFLISWRRMFNVWNNLSYHIALSMSLPG